MTIVESLPEESPRSGARHSQTYERSICTTAGSTVRVLSSVLRDRCHTAANWHLIYLHRVSGSVPAALGRLSQLSMLKLSNNELAGSYSAFDPARSHTGVRSVC